MTLALLPADPGRENIMLEIRAGTGGGEEAEHLGG